jgi:hypothetical protein
MTKSTPNPVIHDAFLVNPFYCPIIALIEAHSKPFGFSAFCNLTSEIKCMVYNVDCKVIPCYGFSTNTINRRYK